MTTVRKTFNYQGGNPGQDFSTTSEPNLAFITGRIQIEAHGGIAGWPAVGALRGSVVMGNVQASRAPLTVWPGADSSNNGTIGADGFSGGGGMSADSGGNPGAGSSGVTDASGAILLEAGGGGTGGGGGGYVGGYGGGLPLSPGTEEGGGGGSRGGDGGAARIDAGGIPGGNGSKHTGGPTGANGEQGGTGAGPGGPTGGSPTGAVYNAKASGASFANATYLTGINFKSNTSTSNGFVTMTYTFVDAPAPPMLNGPVDGQQLDAQNAGVTLFGTYEPGPDSGSMSAYLLRMKVTDGTYVYWNATSGAWTTTQVWNAVSSSGFAAGPNGSFSINIPAGSTGGFVNGNYYNWSVACQEGSSFNREGAFAPDALFQSITAVSVSVTVVNTNLATPTIEWDVTIPSGEGSQSAYQAWVYTLAQTQAPGFVPGLGSPVWTSGLVSSALASSVRIAIRLANTSSFVAFVQIATSDGVESSVIQQSSPAFFTTDYDAPLQPTIAIAQTTDPDTGVPQTLITLTTGDSPSSHYYGLTTADIQYSDDGGNTWNDVRGGSAVPILPTTASVADSEGPFNVARLYRGGVTGTVASPQPGATSPWSASMSSLLSSDQWWLLDPVNQSDDDNGNPWAIPMYRVSSASGATRSGVNVSIEIDQPEQQGVFRPFGRPNPIVTRGDFYNEEFDIGLLFIGVEAWEQFDALRQRRTTLCLRSDLYFGKVYYIALGPNRPQDLHGTVGLTSVDEVISEVIVHCYPQDIP